MNIDTIGYNAGLVWNALNEADALGLRQIKKSQNLKTRNFIWALGWLARENKIAIAEGEDAKDLIISLA